MIQLTTVGLPKDYDSFVTTFSMLTGATSFDDLRSELLFYEQCLNYKKRHTMFVHQAFVAPTSELPIQRGAKATNSYKGNRNNHSKGGRGRNNKNNNKSRSS